MPPSPKDWRIRFVAKYEVGAPDDCWLWKGYTPHKGYGVFRMDAEGYRETSNRAAYIFHKGSIPDGMQVLHSCDNKKCVNPAHLRADTQKVNAEEATDRGLYVTGDAWSDSYVEVLPRGEDHKRAKLTTAQILYIRESPRCGSRLAEELGVAPITVSRIRRRLAWRHVA